MLVDELMKEDIPGLILGAFNTVYFISAICNNSGLRMYRVFFHCWILLSGYCTCSCFSFDFFTFLSYLHCDVLKSTSAICPVFSMTRNIAIVSLIITLYLSSHDIEYKILDRPISWWQEIYVFCHSDVSILSILCIRILSPSMCPYHISNCYFFPNKLDSFLLV